MFIRWDYIPSKPVPAHLEYNFTTIDYIISKGFYDRYLSQLRALTPVYQDCYISCVHWYNSYGWIIIILVSPVGLSMHACMTAGHLCTGLLRIDLWLYHEFLQRAPVMTHSVRMFEIYYDDIHLFCFLIFLIQYVLKNLMTNRWIILN